MLAPARPPTANPADDTGFTRPFVCALREHVARFEAGMPRDSAVAWVYLSVLVAWAEDHELISPWLRSAARPRRRQFLELPAGGIRGWLARAIAALAVHPGTWSLLDPAWTPQLKDGTLPEDACRDLVDWWDSDAPSLAYSVADGPPSLSGWIAGDLLQHLSDERRERHALVQTPWWVADFILDRTLIPAAREFAGQPLRAIDPCCGTGHFLVRMISYLWDFYTTGRMDPQQARSTPAAYGTPVPPQRAAAMILQGLHGCDKDPLTAAVARLRYTAALGARMHESGLIPGPLRLDRIPQFQVPVVPGDSLLAGKITAAAYADLHPRLAAIVNLGSPEARAIQAAGGRRRQASPDTP